MKKAIAPSVLAAALLASAGIFGVAGPAVAQPGWRQASQADIDRFVMRTEGRVQPGEEVRFRLYGTPGGRAWVDVPGVVQGLVLTETRPGSYEGTYTVRRRDDADAFRRAQATLRAGRDQVVAYVDMRGEWERPGGWDRPDHRPPQAGRDDDRGRDGRWQEAGRDDRGPQGGRDDRGSANGRDDRRGPQGGRDDRGSANGRDDRGSQGGRDDRGPQAGRDTRAPQVGEVVPAFGQNLPEGRVEISAKLSDEGSGIDARSVRLRVDGRDVTDSARVSNRDVQYRAELRPGRHKAEVTARDVAGNPVTKAWEFDVVARAAAQPTPPAARPPVAQPAPRPPVVQTPPVYNGPLDLAITSHQNGAVVNARDNVHLEGQTAPNASVRVQVDNQVAGALTKLIDQTIVADGSGHFAVDFSPSGFVIPGQRYEVRLTSSIGNRSVEQRLTLQRRG